MIASTATLMSTSRVISMKRDSKRRVKLSSRSAPLTGLPSTLQISSAAPCAVYTALSCERDAARTAAAMSLSDQPRYLR